MKSTQRLSDLKAMSPDQLQDQLLALKKEQFNLRFQRATGQLENTARVREVRKDIARVRTLTRQKPADSEGLGDRMPKRVLQGVVVTDKQDKTVVVKVERRFTHPVMKKTVRRSKNYHAHDEANAAKTGDKVLDPGVAPAFQAEDLGARVRRQGRRGLRDPRQGEGARRALRQGLSASGARPIWAAPPRERLGLARRELRPPGRAALKARASCRGERKGRGRQIPIRRSPAGNRARRKPV